MLKRRRGKGSLPFQLGVGFLLANLCAVPKAGAETSRTTLPDLIQRAIRRNPDLRLGQLKQEQLKYTAAAVSSGYGPTVSAGANAFVFDSDWAMPVVNDDSLNLPALSPQLRQAITDVLKDAIRPIPVRDQFVYNVNVTIAQPLTGLYEVYQARRAADLLRADAKDAQAMLRKRVTFSVTTAYLTVLQAESLRNLAQRTVQSLAKQEAQAQAMADAEMVGEFVPLEVATARIEADSLVRASQSAVSSAREALASLTGGDVDSLSELESLVGLPDVPGGSLDELVRRAAAERPEMSVASRRRELGERARKIANWQYLPNVNLIGRYDHVGNVAVLPENQFFVGASARLVIWDWGRREAARHQAQALTDQAVHRRESAKRAIEASVRQSYLGLRSARERCILLAQGVRKARASLQIQRDRFDEGLIEPTPLLAAQRTLDRIATEQELARLEAWRNLARLWMAVGDERALARLPQAPKTNASQVAEAAEAPRGTLSKKKPAVAASSSSSTAGPKAGQNETSAVDSAESQ